MSGVRYVVDWFDPGHKYRRKEFKAVKAARKFRANVKRRVGVRSVNLMAFRLDGGVWFQIKVPRS